MVKEIIAKKIYRMILDAGNILLTTHCNPDGDAASSVSAMTQVLDFLKKDYTIWCADKFENKINWLPNLNQALHDETALDFNRFDLIITLDCGSLSRTRLETKIKNRQSYQKLIEIDHHEPLEAVADLSLRLPEAASTTEVIYDWLKINQLPISADLAEAILVGLVTDTGNFFYSSTSEKTLLMASDLINKGANWPKVMKTDKTSADLATAKLWGLAMSRLTINRRYQVAFTVLTWQDFQDLNLDEEADNNLAGFLSRLSGVKMVLVFRENGKGFVKCSARACQDGVNVAKFCNRFGGGGHVKAAGFSVVGKLKQTATGWLIE